MPWGCFGPLRAALGWSGIPRASLDCFRPSNGIVDGALPSPPWAWQGRPETRCHYCRVHFGTPRDTLVTPGAPLSALRVTRDAPGGPWSPWAWQGRPETRFHYSRVHFGTPRDALGTLGVPFSGLWVTRDAPGGPKVVQEASLRRWRRPPSRFWGDPGAPRPFWRPSRGTKNSTFGGLRHIHVCGRPETQTRTAGNAHVVPLTHRGATVLPCGNTLKPSK